MKKTLTIGEIAKLLDVPTATLRFWEENGLFSVEKLANHYRTYTTMDIIRIADVMFYRTLGIPVSQVREIEHCSRNEYAKQMLAMQKQIEDTLNKYEKMKQKLERQLAHVKEVERLSQFDYLAEEIPFDTVLSFDYLERDKLTGYIEDPSRYIRYIDTQNLSSERRGILSDSIPEHARPLWRKKPESHFITFLIREKVEQNYESDLEASLSAIQRHYQTGHLLAQYLMTAMEDGAVIDYLKAYLEIKPL